jgi:putative transposase
MGILSFSDELSRCRGYFVQARWIVSYETIRSWVGKFGHQYAKAIRRDRPVPSDKWHLDEVVITIRGKKYWLWRAVDSKGDVLDILV